MNWDAISAIGEIVGSIAVVITLAYLAVQTRQNSHHTKALLQQGQSDRVTSMLASWSTSKAVLGHCWRNSIARCAPVAPCSFQFPG